MQPTSEKSEELSFKHLINIILRFYRFLLSKWIIILILGIVGLATGIAYGYYEECNYEATLTFSTEEDPATSGGGIAGLAAQFGFNVNMGGLGGVFSGDNIMSLIQSRKMIIQTLLTPVSCNGKQQSLLNIYMDATYLTKALKKNDSLKNISFPVGQDPATFNRVQDSILLLVADGISKNVLKVDKPDKDLDVYSIDCITNNEFFSTEFTRQLITRVSDFYVSTKTMRAQQTVDIIQKRADSVKQVFDAALEGKAYLSDANINYAFQVPQVDIEKKQTDITVWGTAYGEILKNLELAKFNLLNATPYIQIIDEPIMPLKKIKIGRLLGGILGAFIFNIFGIGFIIIRRMIKKAKASSATTS